MPRAHIDAPEKIISGGQTGVDRAALDVALQCGIPLGGWCPKGRLAEDGVIDDRYPLRETDRDEYAMRTAFNVRDAEGTLIIATGALTGGTALTRDYAQRFERPCLVIEPQDPTAPARVAKWIALHAPGVLNVAGPRESTCPGIYQQAVVVLSTSLQYMKTRMNPAE
jgi:hypothetical protein